MGAEEELAPCDARNAAELVALMRRLKERSGLTFRQLEQKAEVHGDVLARSTLADVLRRQSLPRPETLLAFVRACGAGDQGDIWLEARRRISAGEVPDSGTPGEAGEPGGSGGAGKASAAGAGSPPGDPSTVRREGARPHRPRVPVALGVATAALLLLVTGAWIFAPDTESSPSADTAAENPSAVPSAASARSPVQGWSRIRPVGSPGSCLTEGRAAGGVYGSAVAVQGPCTGSAQPRTYLKAVGGGLFHIQWEHPVDGGIGCLTVLDSGPVKDFLEPWDDCGRTRLSQHFRMEAVDEPVPGGYRIRPAHTDLCVSIRGQARDATREAVQKPCDGEAWQEFFVEPV
ncbi:helix-turn-helix domain-containing protein [Streptomyces scopuliridis]|uniref:helix-turn-helix domain-containing protein n=1 Tax=Streptomyces scopuliridis TaxID=452529 RepID=UPI0036BEDABD